MVPSLPHRGCGWCHRVHIVLNQLSIPYKETLLDLSEPRPAWFLDLNPRGLVPVLHYKDSHIDTILTESAPIVHFLLELYPSHLSPTLATPSETALFRFKMNFFVDTWFGKVSPFMFKLVGATSKEAQEEKITEMVALMGKEIEPLLEDAVPYFGGSKELTFVEAMTIPFAMRLYDWADDVIWPESLKMKMEAMPNFWKWTEHGMKQDSVTYVYDKEGLRAGVHKNLEKAKAKYANA